MHMDMRMTFIWGLAAVLAGCSMAGGPVSPPPVPADPESAANVTVYRDTSPEDDAARLVFTINGDGTYQLRPGERYSFVLGAGSYELGYRTGIGIRHPAGAARDNP